MKKCAALAICLMTLLPFEALWASEYTGRIKGFVLYQPGISPLLYVMADDDVQKRPSCNVTNRYTVQMDTDYGKAIYALLLSVYQRKEKIRLFGTGHCNSESSNSEVLSYVCTELGPC